MLYGLRRTVFRSKTELNVATVPVIVPQEPSRWFLLILTTRRAHSYQPLMRNYVLVVEPASTSALPDHSPLSMSRDMKCIRRINRQLELSVRKLEQPSRITE